MGTSARWPLNTKWSLNNLSVVAGQDQLGWSLEQITGELTCNELQNLDSSVASQYHMRVALSYLLGMSMSYKHLFRRNELGGQCSILCISAVCFMFCT